MQWRRAAEADVVDSGDEAERSGEDSELEGDGGVRCCRNNRHQTVGAFVCRACKGQCGCDEVLTTPFLPGRWTDIGVQQRGRYRSTLAGTGDQRAGGLCGIQHHV